MPRTGSANLPLHGGKTPHWLFERLARLARSEKAEALKRLGRLEWRREAEHRKD